MTCHDCPIKKQPGIRYGIRNKKCTAVVHAAGAGSALCWVCQISRKQGFSAKNSWCAGWLFPAI